MRETATIHNYTKQFMGSIFNIKKDFASINLYIATPQGNKVVFVDVLRNQC